MKQFRVTPKSKVFASYDKSGQLSVEYEHQLAGKLEAVVLEYFYTNGPYYGNPIIMYNGFSQEFPYVFTIHADGKGSYHYPLLYLREDKSLSRFKGEIDRILSEEGFSKCKFHIKGKDKQFLGVYFEK